MKKTAAVLLVMMLLTAAAFAVSEEGTTLFVENEWNFVDGSMDISGGIPDTANGVLARIRDNGVLRVATEPYFAPQEFIDPDLEGQAQYAGADMKLAALIAERMGVELVILPMEFTEVLPALNEDLCDLTISALAFTPGRALSNTLSKGYFFAEMPASTTLVIREEDAEKIRTIDDLAKLTLAAQSGSLQETMAAREIYSYKEFRRLGQVQDVYDAVRNGKADAGVVDMENAANYLQNDPDCGLVMAESILFTMEEQYAGDRIAARKGENELMYFVNGVIDEVLEKDLYMQWYREAQERAEELGL